MGENDDQKGTESDPPDAFENGAEDAYTKESVKILGRGWTYPDNPGGSATRRTLTRHRSEKRKPSGDPITSDPFRIRIYNPDDLHRAIREMIGDGNHDDFDCVGPEDAPSGNAEANLSNEETLRLRRLRQVAKDRRGQWR